MKTYSLFKVHINSDEALKELKDVFDSGFLNEGSYVGRFTDELKNLLNTDLVIPLNSCTSAITLALKLSGVKDGKEVITPSQTCIATNTPIISNNGKIIWSDIDPSSGCVNALEIEKKMTRDTVAVICVAWSGICPDLENIRNLCSSRGVKLIIDAAQAWDCELKGKKICAFADFTCYSFQAIKHFTTGDGGALVCSSVDDYKMAKKLKWFGVDRDRIINNNGEWKGKRWDIDIDTVGGKYHMNNVSAAIGLSQLKHIDKIMFSHRNNAKIYAQAFKNVESIVPLIFPIDSNSSFWTYGIVLREDLDRNKLLDGLNAKGVKASLMHVPNHYYSCFKDYYFELPKTDYYYNHQLCLPCGWWLNSQDIFDIINIISGEIVNAK